MPDTGNSPSGPSPDSGCASTKIIFSKYELGRLLGLGASAKVYLARHLPSNHLVAIKIFPKPRRPAGDLSGHLAVMREVSALRRLRHPHILRLYEVLATRTKIYLVMELAKGGELFTKVASAGKLSEEHARGIFQQLIAALAFAHSRGVFHRDIKPENLLLDENGELKVSDFGLASVVSNSGRQDVLHTLCGTPAYVAPEILAKNGYRGAAADVWSAGVVLFVLVAGYLPFNDANLMNMYRKICRGQFRCPRWTSPELRRLLGRLLDTNPETRITVEEVVSDPWFEKGLDRARWDRLMRSDCDEKIAAAPAWLTAGRSPVVDGGDDRRELNAFDLILLSGGLDLSGLVDAKVDRAIFSWTGPVEPVLDRVRVVGSKEGFLVRQKEKGAVGVVLEGQNCNFVANVVVHHFSGEVAVVEVEMCGGGRDGGFWKEKVRGVLSQIGLS